MKFQHNYTHTHTHTIIAPELVEAINNLAKAIAAASSRPEVNPAKPEAAKTEEEKPKRKERQRTKEAAEGASRIDNFATTLGIDLKTLRNIFKKAGIKMKSVKAKDYISAEDKKRVKEYIARIEKLNA